MDYIVNDDGVPYLIEINSVPGMSKESIVPQMIKSENIKLKNILIWYITYNYLIFFAKSKNQKKIF